MARPKQDMTDAEQAIIELLWDKGRASIRQIVDTLHADDPGQTRYATIQKQLERMEAKGLVKRDRSLFVHLFVPALSREEMIGRKLQTVIDKLCGGSLVPLLSQLTRARKLTARERRALRDLLDQQ
ncbi:MAG TPA: BlaI/MecI/CopY family transcriptional regulator [Tepidisphaeraceae bacterium]|jgi:BlaI family penicillinase repressor|nr:BlaI/MecI/CopY family transcriptional regulator [Tepidisphaeraceae bacterium]